MLPNYIERWHISFLWKKLGYTWWLKTTQIYSLAFLEVRNLKWVSLGWNQDLGKATLKGQTAVLSCLFQLLELHSCLAPVIPSIFKATNCKTSSNLSLLQLHILLSSLPVAKIHPLPFRKTPGVTFRTYKWTLRITSHLKTLNLSTTLTFLWGFPGGAGVKNPPTSARDAGDTGSAPGSGRSSGGGNSNPLQYNYLENPTDRGVWRATAHGATKSRIWLSTHARSFCQVR